MSTILATGASHTWKKLGLAIAPQNEISWMTHYAGPSFAVSDGDAVRIFVTGRDSLNQSRIGIVEGTLQSSGLTVTRIAEKPVFDLGDLGCFDESGVSYPWLVKHGDRLYMYYVGWTAGGRTRFQNFTGLAISTDDGMTFQRASRVPLLDRTEEEPYGSGSCAVWIDAGGWHMIYTAFEPWRATASGPKACYRLKEALSDDGVNWHRTGRVVIDFMSPDETIIGKPMLIKDPQNYKLWYSHRGDSYRIGYSESADGVNFVRKDDETGIDVSSTGWDSQMIEYAFVFDHLGSRYMFYNGDDFGRTGLGLAIFSQ